MSVTEIKIPKAARFVLENTYDKYRRSKWTPTEIAIVKAGIRNGNGAKVVYLALRAIKSEKSHRQTFDKMGVLKEAQ